MDDDATSNYPYESLSTNQKQAYDIIMAHYNQGQNTEPLNMIIQGTVGTGKSYLIGALRQAFQDLPSTECSHLLLLAPTRVFAFNIGATTIHGALRIPIADFNKLEGPRLNSFQEDIKHVKYILIDEMSFIGQKMLEHIDYRLCEGFLENSNILQIVCMTLSLFHKNY